LQLHIVLFDTWLDTFDVTVNAPCQMEAIFTLLIPKANVNTEMAANALFTGVERSQLYVVPTTIAQTTSRVGSPETFKAWVTDIAGVPYPSATNAVPCDTKNPWKRPICGHRP
jgi:hypothetical protein